MYIHIRDTGTALNTLDLHIFIIITHCMYMTCAKMSAKTWYVPALKTRGETRAGLVICCCTTFNEDEIILGSKLSLVYMHTCSSEGNFQGDVFTLCIMLIKHNM